MFHYHDPQVADHLFEGRFGLERESLRITPEGFLAQSPHPFTDKHLVCDFCENQTEINTDAHDNLEQAFEELKEHLTTIQKTLKENGELLWPCSNPPIIKNEEDIPIAIMKDSPESRKYRDYIGGRYGRYKMTFCGIHYNFSFSDDLLKADYEKSGRDQYRDYCDQVYLDLAKKASCYGWLINVLTCASPLCDGSFYEKSLRRQTCFSGMASMRNSEVGYWNFFTPSINCNSLDEYLESIDSYCSANLLKEPRELYYPIRLKPSGKYSLENLKENGINHIELRMFDLNPFSLYGISYGDALFTHLFLIYLACLPDLEMSSEMIVQAAQNFKNAAHYDLKTTRIVCENGESSSVFHAACRLLDQIEAFYEDAPEEYRKCIAMQKKKLESPENGRYAWMIRNLYGNDFLESGLKLARMYQDKLCA